MATPRLPALGGRYHRLGWRLSPDKSTSRWFVQLAICSRCLSLQCLQFSHSIEDESSVDYHFWVGASGLRGSHLVMAWVSPVVVPLYSVRGSNQSNTWHVLRPLVDHGSSMQLPLLFHLRPSAIRWNSAGRLLYSVVANWRHVLANTLWEPQSWQATPLFVLSLKLPWWLVPVLVHNSLGGRSLWIVVYAMTVHSHVARRCRNLRCNLDSLWWHWWLSHDRIGLQLFLSVYWLFLMWVLLHLW